jgi:two-component system chemotaxis sensor kinase CheA
MSEMDDVVREFLLESQEGIDQLDQHFLALERNPQDRTTLGVIFRVMHTIKGTTSFLGFTRLEAVAHSAESLLSDLRDGRLALTPNMSSLLLKSVDAIRALLRSIEEHDGMEGELDYAGLRSALADARRPTPVVAVEETDDGASEEPPTAQIVNLPTPTRPPPEPAPLRLVESAPEPAESLREEARAEGGDAQRSNVADSVVRVDVRLLDRVMNQVGELVLARNRLLQHAASFDDATAVAACQRLSLITTELQEAVMKTRMQPIGTVWQKLPRAVRDLSLTCGKKVRLDMEGAETELDRTLIDAIKSPLTHIIRNSIDHGIESPATRVANGKEAEGLLRLRAFHEGGQVNIEIIDDGGGIDPERVKRKAIERGLISEAKAARLTDRELVDLIFQPGFSTAEQVTNVSGRGVGMDVVRTSIEAVGGTVDILSRVGEGTTLKIKIPLTLAIVPALISNCGGERYAIPQASLLELVRLDEEKRQFLENVQGSYLFRLRGTLLPLVFLHETLGIEAALTDRPLNIIVLQAEDQRFGLVVESVNDTEEIVVKPLARQIKGISVYAGATVMGDGRVALILDVGGLARASGVVSTAERVAARNQAAAQAEMAQRQSLLVVAAGGGRVAIPLSVVARLEDFTNQTVQQVGSRTVVFYRGEIMPVVPLASLVGNGGYGEPPTKLRAIIFSEGGRSIGLTVDEIIDIVEETVVLNEDYARPGVLGSTMLRGQVTELLDLAALIQGYDPRFQLSRFAA